MTQNEQPIVVPLDGSKNAELALPAAIRLGQMYNAPLALVHALHGERLESGADRSRAEQVFADYIATIAPSRGLAAGSYSADVVDGPPAEGILRFAARARFIVLASHGRGGFRAALLGSVADKIVRGATVPVLLVPVAGAGFDPSSRPVLVAVDGSREAEEGLEIARDVAARFGTTVAILRAYDTAPPVYVDFAFYPVDYAGALEEAAREYLGEVARPGEKMVLVQGRADLVIHDVAESLDAGLLVMTTQGMGLAKRIALGSTTDRVMRSLQRPLLVVPSSAAADRSAANRGVASSARG